MKPIFLIGAIFCWTYLSFAQHNYYEENTPHSPAAQKGEENHHKKSVILFIEPTFNYVINHGYSEFSIGGSGGVFINRWMLGVYGEQGELKEPLEGDLKEIKWDFHHAVFRLGYLFPLEHNGAEWMIGLQSGWGEMNLESPLADQHPKYQCEIKTFMPEIGYIYPISKMLHVQFSLGYQWVSGINHQYLGSARLNGPVLQFALTFAPHL